MRVSQTAATFIPGVRIWAPWNLVCGEESCVGDGAVLYNQARITLGRRVVVSQGAYLCTGTHDYESAGFQLFAKPIAVGNHAWLAAECFVHPGVTIGEGASSGRVRSSPAMCRHGWCAPETRASRSKLAL